MSIFLQSRPSERDHRIQHTGIILGTDFHFKQTVLITWTKFVQRRHFRSKIGRMNITIKLSMFELIQESTFIWKRHFLDFWNKFSQILYFQSKTGKVNTTISFSIFQLVFMQKFYLKQTNMIFLAKLAQRG